MNYYKQGDAANADKIKAAFEKLGYDTSFVKKLSASDVHILFTLSCDYRVHAFHTAYIEADILKRLVSIDPDYKELELPIEPKFKKGETIKSDSGSWVVKEVDVENQCYVVNDGWIEFKLQDHFNLVESQPKFKVGDVVLYYGGLYRVEDVLYTKKNGSFYNIGNLVRIPEIQLTLADHRDEIRILKGGEQ